jgi:polysaccharide pyruvyl transferase WcaK-like protein
VRAAENGESRLVDAYAAAFENLADEGAGISVVYVAHDGRASDLRLGEEVRERLPERLRARFHLQRPAPAAALKGLCGALDVALSGRMHMAIACLGQGVPVACQPYQGKFEGLFEHFGLEGHVLSPHRFLDAEGLTHDLRRLLERSGEIRARISARLPHVLALAAANFEPAPGEPR